MCLNYGTPHRFSQVKQHGASYPLECELKSTLIELLQQEFADGVYTEELYHPLLIAMLHGLTFNHVALPEGLQEHRVPFCDLIQSTAMLFGFINDNLRMPSASLQDYFLQQGIDGMNGNVYGITRVIVVTVCPPEVVLEWYALLKKRKPQQRVGAYLTSLAMEKVLIRQGSERALNA